MAYTYFFLCMAFLYVVFICLGGCKEWSIKMATGQRQTSDWEIHQKLGFTDTDLAENFNLADNIATTDVFYLLIAET